MDEFLRTVPDLTDWSKLETWIQERLDVIAGWMPDAEALNTFTCVTLPRYAYLGSALGLYGSPSWRKLAITLVLADWATYDQPADRVDFARMLHIAATFPDGFRLWMCRMPDGAYAPVGYSGWYPIAYDIYQVLLTKPENVTHRGFAAPIHEVGPGRCYLYLFNVSVIKQLRPKTPQSAAIMRAYVGDIARQRPLGMAAITVSEDGARVSRRLGLRHVGNMMFEGVEEPVFASD